jgi:cell division protein YceG involved in septum cleavage
LPSSIVPSSDLSAGAKVGIGIGATAGGLLLLSGTVYFFYSTGGTTKSGKSNEEAAINTEEVTKSQATELERKSVIQKNAVVEWLYRTSAKSSSR